MLEERARQMETTLQTSSQGLAGLQQQGAQLQHTFAQLMAQQTTPQVWS